MKKPLWIALLIVAASCGSSDAVRNHQKGDEIALLRQQLAQRDRQIGLLEQQLQQLSPRRDPAFMHDALVTAALHMNGIVGTPELAGRVTAVSGETCTITVDANPGNVDIERAVADRTFSVSRYSDDRQWNEVAGYLRFAIYGEDGYKAEVRAFAYDAESNSVMCKNMDAGDGVIIVAGDNACTKP